MWFASAPGHAPTFSVLQTEQETWTVQTDESNAIHIVQRRPLRPAGGKGVPDPWSTKPTAGKAFSSPPYTGWYDIKVQSTNALTIQSVYWKAPVGERLSNHGIHPAPKRLEALDGKGFVFNKQAKVCAEQDDLSWPQEWFVREMKRLTGVTADLGCTGANIHFIVQPDLDVPNQGFELWSEDQTIRLLAPDAQGLIYGAIALSDWIGIDGKAAAAHIQDWPTVQTRALFHHAVPNSGAMVPATDTMAFIERVVARGRYNMLILSLSGAMPLPSRPKLVRKDAWSSDDLQAVLDLAKKYGIEVIPAINSPSHSAWLVRAYPALSEEGAGNLLCMQHPGTRALLEDLYKDVFEAFEHPRFIHIGHDEIRFRTKRKHEDQRCARCNGTPRWRLLEEDLLWNHSTLSRLGTRPMLWSDMLLQRWNGSWDGMHRVVNRIPESIRPDFMVMSWGRVGDTLGTLVPMGYAVMRGNTGYGDWKREGLEPVAAGVAGEALALFVPTPWNSMDGSMEGVQLYHHWSNAVLAGATAWEPRIESTPIETSLGALLEHPAYLPGYKAWPQDTKIREFTGDQPPDSPWMLDDHISVNGVPYSSLVQFSVSTDESERFLFGRRLVGISMLQAVDFPKSERLRLAHAHRKQPAQRGQPVVEFEVSYKDESTLKVPVRIGLDTNQADVPLRGSLLWSGAGGLRVSSVEGGPATQRLYRLDWHNPHPEKVVQSIRFYSKDRAVQWWVVGLASVNPPSKKKDLAQ